ncbi:MAG: HlyD family type I secretion periplasmic adaptor subunit [Pseudomonadota bacterium]
MTIYAEPMKITSPTLHATIWFTMSVFVAILVMSFVFKVEVVAQGQGRVVPLSRVQVVQPEFAGRITGIHVRNGDAVIKGDILLELDPTEALTELGTIRAESDRLEIELARIAAMVSALLGDVSDPGFADVTLGTFAVPASLAGHPFATEQRDLLHADVIDLRAAFAQIAAREAASKKSEDVTQARIAQAETTLAIQRERFAMAETLLQQGTTSRANFMEAEQAMAELEQEREVYLRELDQKVAERQALVTERRRFVSEMRSNLLKRRSEIDTRLATLAQEDQAAHRRLAATTLTAPASGIVDQMTVFTVGGVADAGAELMRIVPTDVEVEIESTFSNQDIGFMDIGQPANIGLDAFPSERFGFVTGRVVDIAADSAEIEKGQWGYTVRVAPDDTLLASGEESFAFRPGMTATVNVTTDERRLISYFFAPIVQTIQGALGER